MPPRIQADGEYYEIPRKGPGSDVIPPWRLYTSGRGVKAARGGTEEAHVTVLFPLHFPVMAGYGALGAWCDADGSLPLLPPLSGVRRVGVTLLLQSGTTHFTRRP